MDPPQTKETKENTAYQIYLIHGISIQVMGQKINVSNSLGLQHTQEVEEYISQRGCKANTAPRTARNSQEIQDRESRYLTQL